MHAKVFISWSGELSHQAAIVLRNWLPVVLPYIETWVSSEDIPKGSRWTSELSSQLETTNFGIICLVPGNSEEPWLNFEAGALSKSVSIGRVCPFLLNVEPSSLKGPLTQFQSTQFTKEDVQKLVISINQSAGDCKLADSALSRNFEICWSDLENKLRSLADQATSTQFPNEDAARTFRDEDVSKLTEEHVAALNVLANANQRVYPEELAAKLRIHPQRALHLMEELAEIRLLNPAHNYMYGTSWILSRKGRSELVKRGLL